MVEGARPAYTPCPIRTGARSSSVEKGKEMASVRRNGGCLAGLILAALAVQPAAGIEVTIVTWNILTYNDPGSPEYEATVRIVEALDPDVLLVQEANDNDGRAAFMAHFAGDLPHSYLGSPSSGNPRNQILSAFPLLNTLQIFTDDPDGGLFERPTIRADLDVIDTQAGTELRVYSAHHKSGTASRDNILRLNQATDDASDVISYLNSNPGALVFYGGDLNAELGDASLNKLLEPQTTLSRLTIVDPNNGSAVTRWPSGKTIDHLLVTPDLLGIIGTKFIFHSNTFNVGALPPPVLSNDSHLASDHLALVTTVNIGPDDPGPGNESIRLNEVFADQIEAIDTHEFIELVGPPELALTGLSVIVIEGDSPNPGVVDRIWTPGFSESIGAGGYYLLGNAALNPDFQIGTQNVLETGTQTILLVQNTSLFVGVDIDPDNDGVPDFVDSGTIIDSVALADGGLGSGDRVYHDAPVIGPVGGNIPPGAARLPDGQDTDTSDDWTVLSAFLDASDGQHPITPGRTNLAGDLDGDGDVDEIDRDLFIGGLSGANVPATDPDGDLDLDGDADLDDYAILQLAFTGS
jgi:endonuclease/exonuclease/phosphatase family metal-dependent hydrolase